MDEKVYPLPDRYRVSLDVSDEEAYARLKQADKEQLKLKAKATSPFSRNPRELARRKALIAIDTLANVSRTNDQTIQLAEAFAVIGRYDVAESLIGGGHYQKYWDAVWLDDANWCQHPVRHTYIKEYVYSVKEGREMPLMMCNSCRKMNVADSSSTVNELQGSQYQGKTKGMSIDAAKAFHSKNLKSR